MGVAHMNCIPWFVFMSAYKCCSCYNQKYGVVLSTPYNTNRKHPRIGTLQDGLAEDPYGSMKLTITRNIIQ